MVEENKPGLPQPESFRVGPQVPLEYGYPTNPQAVAFVRESRPHDYLYDPIYLNSNQINFNKDAYAGSKANSRLNMRPNFGYMFGDVARFPRVQPCLKPTNQNPMNNFVSLNSIGGMPVYPTEKYLPMNCVDVKGKDRAKFIERYTTPKYKMAVDEFDYNLEEIKKRENTMKLSLRKKITRGTQTDYRESETQTDPYSPPYVLPASDAFPKLLALEKFTWKNGLPAMLKDVPAIDRALLRRVLELEARSKAGWTNAAFAKRIKILEKLEAQDWEEKEEKMAEVQEYKMKAVDTTLNTIHSSANESSIKKMENFLINKEIENEEIFLKLQNKFCREFRKLEAKYRTDNKPEKSKFKMSVRPCVPAPGMPFDLCREFDSINCLLEDEKFVKKELTFDATKFSKSIQLDDTNYETKDLKDLREAIEHCEQKEKGIFSLFKQQQGQVLKN